MRHSETTCLWKATLQSLGPDALFRTISSEVEVGRLQTEPQVPQRKSQTIPYFINALFTIWWCQHLPSIMLQNSTCEHSHANRYVYSQLFTCKVIQQF